MRTRAEGTATAEDPAVLYGRRGTAKGKGRAAVAVSRAAAALLNRLIERLIHGKLPVVSRGRARPPLPPPPTSLPRATRRVYYDEIFDSALIGANILESLSSRLSAARFLGPRLGFG